ncbi:MAG TPA: hypothetical protein VNA32_02745, partial [Actinomycetota bacterium]|nr:hypothetical protein [Actinomycetota bacterium]
MARPQALSEPDKVRAVSLRRQKVTHRDIARALGVSETTIGRFFRGQDGAGRLKGMPSVLHQRGPAAAEKWEEANPAPKSYGELSERARRGLVDFPFFCSEILGEALTPHQERWHNAWAEAGRRGKRFKLRLAPPRHGKTDLENKTCVWYCAGGGHPLEYYDQLDPPLRDVRIMLVSGAETQSDKNFEYIQVRLAGHARLIGEYGRFKESGNPWRPSARVLVIAGRRKLQLSGDFTLVCVGTGSHVLGRGADKIIGDDPFDIDNVKTPEQAVSMLRWIRLHVFSRLEPARGTIDINGAKLPVGSEPYTQIQEWPATALRKLAADEDLTVGAEGYERLFDTTVEPAINVETGELLFPLQRSTGGDLIGWTPETLEDARSLAGEDGWAAMWMQAPRGGRNSLAFPEWVYGGVIDHVQYPGCLDHDRRWGESISPLRNTPTGREVVPSIRVVTIDPSDVMYWGILCMDLFTGGSAYSPVLLDLDRNKHKTASVLTLLEAWQTTYDFRVLVLERNIAKFLIEDERFTDFCRRYRVKVIYHHTGENKNSRAWGIGTLADDIEHARIRIPNADAESRWKFQYLVKEMLGELGTNDLLMALWFPKFNLAGLLALASS